mmetsp:Transcript_23994/g.82961  ORF Transcript_23994/g.82961 Transcript_23994/m.82961 type:complete len:207 (-) Transcript_23994:619-1239(-)
MAIGVRVRQGQASSEGDPGRRCGVYNSPGVVSPRPALWRTNSPGPSTDRRQAVGKAASEAVGKARFRDRLRDRRQTGDGHTTGRPRTVSGPSPDRLRPQRARLQHCLWDRRRPQRGRLRDRFRSHLRSNLRDRRPSVEGPQRDHLHDRLRPRLQDRRWRLRDRLRAPGATPVPFSGPRLGPPSGPTRTPNRSRAFRPGLGTETSDL